MKKFYVVANSNKTGTLEAAEGIKAYLEERNASCIIRHGYLDPSELTDDIECIITLGGDGTLLKAADAASSTGVPLVGVNMGRIGYLTTVSDVSGIPGLLDAALNDDYTIEKRIMLNAEWTDSETGVTSTGRALNEVVIGRKMNLRPVGLRVNINGVLLNEYSADGIIISTPTGSTGYNLSAGGPILETSAEMAIITPICPHALTPSSIVVSSHNRIDVDVTYGDAYGQAVILDGNICGELNPGSTVRISRAEEEIRLLTLKDFSFTDNLRKKLERL